MIIIGSVELTFTKRTGTFYCPKCTEESTFRHRRKRRFLTLYFIPVIPLDSTGEFVECSSCRETFEVEVADMPADAIRASQRQATLELIRRALVTIVAADQEVTDEELEAVLEFTRKHDLPDAGKTQLLQEAAMVRQTNMDALQYCRHIAPRLKDEDKELLVYHAFLAATASGALSDARTRFLKELPGAVGVSELRFREIVVHAIDR